ncbi:MAG: 4Fe-4S binding protein, partial [Clostridia bacterium]|nr:4Fe-4S binding protein [Clostridia bacterium]
MGTYGSDTPDQGVLDWTNMITHVRRKAKAHDYDTIGIEAVATPEMAQIALKMEWRKPKSLDEIAELMGCKTDIDKLHLEDVLEEMSYLGLAEFDRENPEKIKKYSIKSFVPGISEMLNEHREWYEEYPQLAEHFELMTYQPFDGAMMGIKAMGLTQMIPEGGAGVGMHVIPVEKAIESENTSIDLEHISYWLDKYDGKYAVTPCSCRQERHERGVGCADDPNHWCIGLGDFADYMVETKKPGYYIDKEEVLRILKVAEDNGFVHQISNIDGEDKIWALCNCDVKICNALRTSMLFNTPNLSASAYTAKVNPQNCVACGRCVEFCPAGAVKLGQKLKCKDGSEMTYEFRDDPADHIWLKDRWTPNYRDENREETYESGTAPCKSACPAHIAIQGYLQMAKEGRYDEALELIKRENPFPAVCGRVCNRKCEEACTRGTIDEAVAIDEVKKFIAQRDL